MLPSSVQGEGMSRNPGDCQPAGAVFFVHIPKTGGLSIKTLLVDAIGAEWLHPLHMPGPADHHHLSKTLDPRVRLITGHWDFSPAETNPRLRPVTMLREPIARLTSHFLYMRRTNDRWNRHWHECIRRNGLGLSAFYARSDASAAFENLQTRQLAGCLYSQPDASRLRPSDDELVERALRNLDRCEFVGVTEDFSMSARVLQHTLGFPAKVGPHAHLNQRPRGVSPSVDAAVLEPLVRLDRVLYARARARLDSLTESICSGREGV